ncbi:hypothetical protein SDJN02_17349, partial [Cucurbita argyrosperma subsp. argyrosperma]
MDGRSSCMEIESYYGPPRPPPPSSYPQTQISGKKGKRTSGSTSSSSSSSSCSSSCSTSKPWRFGDPEFQRKKRVASYKMYSVEGKMKGSFRNSFRWLKGKYTQILYGWW